MKKLILWLLGIVGILVLVVLAAFFLTASYMDEIIEQSAKTIIPSLTKTEFKLDAVHTEPQEGKIELVGLYLGNPEGFPEGHAIKFDNILVKVDWKSLNSDKVIIESLIIDGLDVYLEKGDGQKSNLEAILANIEESVQEIAEQQDYVDVEELKKEVKKQAKEAKPLHFQVNLFELDDAHVIVHVEKGLAAEAEIEISQVKLENLGVDGKGLTVKALIQAIAKEIVKEVHVAVKLGSAAKKDKGKASNDKEEKDVGGVIKGFFQRD